MAYVRQDYISVTLTITAVAVFIYSATFSPELMLRSTFAIVVALSGIALATITKTQQVEQDISQTDSKLVLVWSAISFFAILTLNLFVPAVPFATTADPLGRRLFAVLIAVAEENFFRGFITPFIATRLNSVPLGAILAGLMFAIYHIAVYGSINVLLIVLGSGIVLSYAVLRTKRLSPTILAHVINNFLATG